MAETVSTAEIARAMRETYCQPEWAIFFEVGNATGFNARRHADAVAMNMYPSRGIALHGFEFKVSKGDWRRELADPQKAEEIAQYCDFWSVVCCPDIIGPGELPLGWGHIEFKGGKLRTRQAAVKHDSKPMPRSFVAAILRGQAKIDEADIKAAVGKSLKALREEDERHVKRQIDERTRDAQEFMSKHSVFVQAMKDHRFRYISDEAFLRAIRTAIDLNLDGEFGGLKGVRNTLRTLTDATEKAIADIATPKTDIAA